MSTTYAVLQQMVANRLGKTDNATANTLRDNAIIDADAQANLEAPWSWNLATASLSVSAGQANMPTDYNPAYGLKGKPFSAVTGTANDHYYERAEFGDLDVYSTSEYVYKVLYNNTTDRYVFYSNQTTDTVTIYYWQIAPAISSTQPSRIPDPFVVRDLAVALWWLAAERDETNHDRWYDKRYVPRLNDLKAKDRVHNTLRTNLKSPIDDSSSINESILSTRR